MEEGYFQDRGLSMWSRRSKVERQGRLLKKMAQGLCGGQDGEERHMEARSYQEDGGWEGSRQWLAVGFPRRRLFAVCSQGWELRDADAHPPPLVWSWVAVERRGATPSFRKL